MADTKYTTHIDLTEEEKELFNKVKGKLYAQNKTIRQWFIEKLNEEVYPPLSE